MSLKGLLNIPKNQTFMLEIHGDKVRCNKDIMKEFKWEGNHISIIFKKPGRVIPITMSESLDVSSNSDGVLSIDVPRKKGKYVIECYQIDELK